MKRRFYFHPLYFLFWVLYFIVARVIFLLYHFERSRQLSGFEIIHTFYHGLKLDLSFTAYLCVLPFLASLLSLLWKRFNASLFVRWYTYTFIFIISALLSADLELYSFWGFRLDATPIQYLNTPVEMLASAAAAPLLLLSVLTLATTLLFAFLYRSYIDLKHFAHYENRWLLSGLVLFVTILLILPMRGGVQQIPINQSVVYFSDKPYANHAGLNMPWNLMHALLKYKKESFNPYNFMPEQEAAHRVQALYATAPDSAVKVISSDKPNVLFIILESFTAKFVGSLGGEQGVTPNLDKLAAEGINFTNMYASGDRSEKGLVSILSGYPVQTITSIIKTPKKTENLPQLSKAFAQQGYSTSFYYGGELEFANIKSYLYNGGYHRLIDKYQFPASSYNSKWGAHDHVLFDRVLKDLQNEREPFFTTVFTLSSHEPYEIPIPAKFPGNDNAAKFRNAAYYTDWALGEFIEQAKKEAWWQNTLVVLIADHGHTLPGDDANHLPIKFRIPFILTGGALTENGLKVNTLGSQTDIATTLLYQLDIPHKDFRWGLNLLAQQPNPFAFYVFNDGFGFITEQGTLVFDNVAQRPIIQEPGVTDEQLQNGKAYMQYSFEDFLKK